MDYLEGQTDYKSSKEIADNCHLSVSNVKYAIRNIKNRDANILLTSAKGTMINRAYKNSLVKHDIIPSNYQERKNFIIKKCLIDGESMSLHHIADYFAITEGSLQNEILKIRKELAPFHLHITAGKKIAIVGPKDKKMELIMRCLKEETKNSFNSISKIQNYFTSVDLHAIKTMVIKVLNQNEYYLDNYSLNNYILHLALMIEIKQQTINDAAHDSNKSDFINICSPHQYSIIEDVFHELKRVYPCHYEIADVVEASVSMITRSIAIENAFGASSKNALGNDINELINEIVASVESNYGINLNNNNFLVRFGVHLSNLMKRSRYGIKLKNLQFDTIKIDYPMVYAIAVHIVKIIEDKMKYPVSEEEISFIAIHIGNLIEQQTELNDKPTCILVCTDYINIGKELFKRINDTFQNKLLLYDVVTSFDDIDSQIDIDLIVSTTPIPRELQGFHKEIGMFLSNRDITELNQMIDLIVKNKEKQQIKMKTQYFFKEDLFFAQSAFTSSSEVINTVCDKMHELGYVSREYKKEIIEHEKISSSAYGKIAIPHPLGNKEDKSAISLIILKKPIIWGKNTVSIIFMLSLSEKDKTLFKDIFSLVSKFIISDENFKKLSKITQLHEFIDLIISE